MFKKLIPTILAGVVMSCTVIHTGGCKKTESHEESQTRQPDGTVVKHEDTVQKDNSGNVVHTHTDKVDK